MQSYFQLLDIPVTFALDLKQLDRAYFQAQRTTHPDRLVGKPEAERVQAILQSQLVNEAYEALKNPLHRAEHLLELQNIFVNVDEGEGASPALLMEMMELRERLADAADNGAELMTTLNEIKKAASDCQAALASLFEAQNYANAAEETMRLNYLMKAMEEAHMVIYRLKAGAR
jgi:molecular chaperone HscB